MTPTVTLTVANGNLPGKEFVFAEPLIGFIGRAKDCEIHLPDEPDYALVSRHHCLLDIEPPEISVSDFGSLNGTFVNGMRIHSERKPNVVAVPLGDRDELRVGQTVFRVAIHAPSFCADCRTELGAFEIAFPDGDPDEQLCAACREKVTEREGMPAVHSM
jgi:eukaryotic-like serine/threonine-protein kinase